MEEAIGRIAMACGAVVMAIGFAGLVEMGIDWIEGRGW